MTSEPVVPKGDGALVRLRVSPNAKSTGLRGTCGEAERFVARMTGAAPSGVRVVRGLSGRDKTAFVDGVGAERVREVFHSRQR